MGSEESGQRRKEGTRKGARRDSWEVDGRREGGKRDRKKVDWRLERRRRDRKERKVGRDEGRRLGMGEKGDITGEERRGSKED